MRTWNPGSRCWYPRSHGSSYHPRPLPPRYPGGCSRRSHQNGALHRRQAFHCRRQTPFVDDLGWSQAHRNEGHCGGTHDHLRHIVRKRKVHCCYSGNQSAGRGSGSGSGWSWTRIGSEKSLIDFSYQRLMSDKLNPESIPCIAAPFPRGVMSPSSAADCARKGELGSSILTSGVAALPSFPLEGED